jgi:heptosyltransferase-3
LIQAGFLGYPLAAICPGAKKETQRWLEDRFSVLGSLLLKTYPDLRLLMLGGQEDQSLGNRLSHSWGSACLNLMGILSVWESAAALQLCSIYVGNDTGGMHLAASVGTPCVAIFSARDNPGRWEPWGEKHSVLRHDVPCAGCYREICFGEGLICLKSITVGEVFDSASKYLSHA